tara:strand:- start:2558 stop:2806 length:249 start_codon:yes stop_codon:yes gene_type:complete
MKLKEILKIDEIMSGRKTPCDIVEFLEDEYYSTSKKDFVKYGDMDLIHFIRSNNKEFRELEINKSELEKYKSLKNLILENHN